MSLVHLGIHAHEQLMQASTEPGYAQAAAEEEAQVQHLFAASRRCRAIRVHCRRKVLKWVATARDRKLYTSVDISVMPCR